MGGVTWADALTAVGSILTPLVVAVFVFIVTSRQSRNDELLRARIESYRTLMPDLNTLMCYVSFMGGWRDLSPIEIIALKRRLDREAYCALPLFSDPVRDRYEEFMAECFKTFGNWGEDPRIISSAYRRREAWISQPAWDPAWDAMFTVRDDEPIPGTKLQGVRRAHDGLVAALVGDLAVTRARAAYTSNLVSLNAHAPVAAEVEGRPTGQS